MTENWRHRFINRTHDLELYRMGFAADPELRDRVYNQMWHKYKDHEYAENAARINVIWLGFETATDSPMLDKYL